MALASSSASKPPLNGFHVIVSSPLPSIDLIPDADHRHLIESKNATLAQLTEWAIPQICKRINQTYHLEGGGDVRQDLIELHATEPGRCLSCYVRSNDLRLTMLKTNTRNESKFKSYKDTPTNPWYPLSPPLMFLEIAHSSLDLVCPN